jgi:mannose-1-phosphate guanylyltransferase/mannose-6-phosphate isomerase
MRAPVLVPVVLCGGSGTRLWPLSRAEYPKQFLRLTGKESLLQQTLQRLTAMKCEGPLLLAHEDARFIVAEQLQEIGINNASILLEPVKRNTAPAIVSAALLLLQQHEDALMLILPSDHALEDNHAFHIAVERAREAAQAGSLMTFGVKPLHAETGYGYLRANSIEDQPVMPLTEFIEKPDRSSAERYLASGQYYWNSGMFLFRASQLLDEIERFAPALLDACRNAMAAAVRDKDFVRLDADAYATCPSIAIDYALMERTANAAMVELNTGWSDIGSWTAVWQTAKKDSDQNAVHGDALLLNCKNCLVHGNHRLVAAVGLNDITVIDTADALLVMDSRHAQDERKLVDALLQDQRPEASLHRQVMRPWGSYDAISSGRRFQVKRITIKPGAKLSLQLHHHRAEHWVVVAGTARVTHGEKSYLLTENQAAYIDIGDIHSLENPGKIPLELIEVQSGSYLGEDDIVRLHDRYGRA